MVRKVGQGLRPWLDSLDSRLSLHFLEKNLSEFERLTVHPLRIAHIWDHLHLRFLGFFLEVTDCRVKDIWSTIGFIIVGPTQSNITKSSQISVLHIHYI